MSDLEERVAALEELVAHPLQIVSAPPDNFSDAQVAELRQQLGDAMRGPFTHRVIQPPPPLSPDEVRQLLRECVTVVKPGETLVIRDRNWTPNQVREIQDWMDDEHEDGTITVTPSIVITTHVGTWHGFLERGVWRECR